VAGSRQTGKSTLVQAVQAGLRQCLLHDGRPQYPASARRDPKGFVEALPPGPSSTRSSVPRRCSCPSKPRSIGTAARPLRVDRLGQCAGTARVSTVWRGAGDPDLWPLAQAEIEGTSPDSSMLASPPGGLAAVARAVADDSSPARVGRWLSRNPGAGRQARHVARWFDGYLTTLVQRDVRDLARSRAVIQAPALLAHWRRAAGSPLNFADLGRNLAMNQMTVKRYIALFEALFLVVALPPWSDNLGKRLPRQPDLLQRRWTACAPAGCRRDGLAHQSVSKGALVENFAVMELMKLAANSQARPSLFHFRTSSGQKVTW